MKFRFGFTLMELMVVILIIAVLAACALPVYKGLADKAVIAEAEGALGVLKRQLEAYRLEYGQYPDTALEFATSEYYESFGAECTYVDDSCFDYKSSDEGYLLICTSEYAGNAGNVVGVYYAAPNIERFKEMNVKITLDNEGNFTVTDTN